jgi:hypothetical protein
VENKNITNFETIDPLMAVSFYFMESYARQMLSKSVISMDEFDLVCEKIMGAVKRNDQRTLNHWMWSDVDLALLERKKPTRLKEWPYQIEFYAKAWLDINEKTHEPCV